MQAIKKITMAQIFVNHFVFSSHQQVQHYFFGNLGVGAGGGGSFTYWNCVQLRGWVGIGQTFYIDCKLLFLYPQGAESKAKTVDSKAHGLSQCLRVSAKLSCIVILTYSLVADVAPPSVNAAVRFAVRIALTIRLNLPTFWV